MLIRSEFKDLERDIIKRLLKKIIIIKVKSKPALIKVVSSSEEKKKRKKRDRDRNRNSFPTFQSPLIGLKLKKVKLSDLEKGGIIHQSLFLFNLKTTGDFNEVLKRHRHQK